MAGAKRGLGRGLGALFGEDTVEKVVADEKAADRSVANGAARIVEKNNKKTEKRKKTKTNPQSAAKTEKRIKAKEVTKAERPIKAEDATKARTIKAEKAIKAEDATKAEKVTKTGTATKTDAEIKATARKNQEAEIQPKEDSKITVDAADKGETELTPANEIRSEITNILELEDKMELELNISEIEPNQNQPRKAFNQAQLEELADSIRKYGVLQPLLVQKKDGNYKIIAGERRWRAAKLAGLKTVPAVVREYSVQQAMEIALIENLQREDLNPIEEAQAYQRLIEEFSLKQEEIAERVSKNRTTVTNSLRLLNLNPEVQQMLVEGRLTSGHARALLAVADPKQQLELAKKVEAEHMSVREVEKAVKLLGKEKKEKKKDPVDEAVELVFQDMENRMKTVMGTKVNISRKDKTKGKIEIEYYSEAELERLVELIESIQPV